MKKKYNARLLGTLLSLILVLCAACTGPQTESSADASAASPTQSPYVWTFPEAAEEGKAEWPDAEGWAAMGLPDLSLTELSGISIRRSKDSENADFLYYEAVTLVCQPRYNTRFSVLTERLDKAGIEGGIQRDDMEWKIYLGTYEFGGEKMAIEIREDGIGWTHITVMGHVVKKGNGQ